MHHIIVPIERYSKNDQTTKANQTKYMISQYYRTISYSFQKSVYNDIFQRKIIQKNFLTYEIRN